MAKLYNVLKADPAGEIWESHGNQLQTFFLKLEGIDKTVTINRQAGSPLLSGPTWLELTETTSKKGSTYFKAKKVQPPEDPQTSQTATQAVQQPLPLGMTQDTITWGQAVLAAATLLASKEAGISDVTSWARDLYLSAPPDREAMRIAEEVKKDVLLTPAEEDKIDLSEIPF